MSILNAEFFRELGAARLFTVYQKLDFMRPFIITDEHLVQQQNIYMNSGDTMVLLFQKRQWVFQLQQS